MIREITHRTEQPFSAVTFIVTTFADGTQFSGTGALVGRNDILTATHLVYSPDNGGWATDIQIYPGVDYNQRLNRFESEPLIKLDSFNWRLYGWPDRVFEDDDNETLTSRESEYDVAVIGIDKPIGDQLGWFNLNPGYESMVFAEQIGYPEDGTGMMYGNGFVRADSFFSTYNSVGGTDIMGPGSSGGPLYVMENGVPQLIGVKSSGSETTSHWTDISLTYDYLVREMTLNDRMLAGLEVSESMPVRIGTPGPDRFYATNQPETFSGNGGLDVVNYNARHDSYTVTSTMGGYVVASNARAADKDLLIGIERIDFYDGTMAIDVGGGATAGMAYRVYQAAFDRKPDTPGLKFWIGEMDKGYGLHQVAELFTTSPEYQGIYGTQPSNDDVLTRYYMNVLGRGPDGEGYNYWMDQLNAGLDHYHMLAYFSESPENQALVAPVIQNGIWLG
ncbi:DUF4214 domain-containing protein [Pseudomonas sp. Marseille-QA0892]